MNRLSEESSPYLRQHAENPVDWWPWCADALARAQAEDKPILLSIGYSACHWCHVMAHESFEDEATARLMNALFVCIKVDREERPDLDKIYQLAHQALTRRAGGWPLTVFLTPDDHLPFYAGTYFPKDARYGMPPFAYVLEQVRGYWDTRRDDVRRQNAALAEFLADYDRTAPSDDALSHAPIDAALARFRASFDAVNGGHLGAPRFPHCPEMELMLDLGESAMVDLTLARMADGGI
ncbi:MAG TPA: thioredoxin domain-containing protein, partial [Rudaea sp.]|nr:thioredoxin domain-containing protein [Rudaea sp.]